MVRFKAGQVVTSRAGRDAGRAYVVVAVQPDGVVLVADGQRRTVARPKRKNPRHLMATGYYDGELGERLVRGEPVRDNDVVRTLEAYAACEGAAAGAPMGGGSHGQAGCDRGRGHGD